MCGTQIKISYPLRRTKKLDDPITEKDWKIIFEQDLPEDCKDDLHELFKNKNEPTPMAMTARAINLCLTHAGLDYRILVCGYSNDKKNLALHKMYKVAARTNGH